MKASLEIDGVIVDCWSALILVSQGCCLRRLASFLAFKSLSLSRTRPNLATCLPFSIFFPSPVTLYSSQYVFSLLLYLISFILLLPHPTEHIYLFSSLSIPPFRQTDRHHAASSGLEKSSGNRTGGLVQPAGGQR